MIKKIMLIAIVCCVLTACGRQNDNSGIDDPLYFEIKIPEDLHYKHMTVPDSIFSFVEYIPLETSDETIFDMNFSFIVNDGQFYLFDRNSKTILCFDSDGNFILKKSLEGRGPGEFVRADDFRVIDGEFFFMSVSPDRIMKYSRELEFVNSLPLGFASDYFEKTKQHFYFHTRINLEEKYSIHVIDTLGKVVNRYFEFDKTAMHVTGRGLTSCNDTVYAVFYNDYNIYQLTPEGYSVYATLDFGEDNVSEEMRKESNYPDETLMFNYLKEHKFRPPVGLGDVYISDKYLIVGYSSWMLNRYLIYNKSNDIVYDQAITNSPAYPLVRGTQFMAFKDNMLYTVVPASAIVRAISSGDGVFPDKLKNISSTDNPVVVVYGLR